MKHIFFLVCIILLQTSCIKEKQTYTILKIDNQTNYSISIYPYKKGVLNKNDLITLNPNEKIEEGKYFTRGISNIPLAFPSFIDNSDSIVVSFNSTYKIAHQNNDTTKNSIRHYIKSSLRNLYNIKSFTETILEDNKYNRKWELKYSFNEQDYLDAKP